MMKKLIALMLLVSVLGVGCKAQVKAVDVGGGPGIAVVLSEEDKTRVDDGISKFENVVDKLNEVLPVVANIAKLAGEVSGDEDFKEKTDDVAGAAEKGAAGLGILLALAGLVKNIVKKEGS